MGVIFFMIGGVCQHAVWRHCGRLRLGVLNTTRTDGNALALEESLLGRFCVSTGGVSAWQDLRQADFRLLLHCNACRQHLTNVLNQQFTAGVATRFMNVTAHCDEPLNKAAEAPVATEVDDSPMAGALHPDPDPVQLNLQDHPGEWDTQRP